MANQVTAVSSSNNEPVIAESKNQETVAGRTYLLIRGATQLDRETNGLKGGDANKAVERKGVVANVEKVVQEQKFSNVVICYGPEGHYKQTAEVAAEQLKARGVTVVTEMLNELRKVVKPVKADPNDPEASTPAAAETAEKQVFETTQEQVKRMNGAIATVASKGDEKSLRVIVTDGALILNFLRELQKTDKVLQAIAEGKSLRPHNDDVYQIVRDANGKDAVVKRFGHVSRPRAPKVESTEAAPANPKIAEAPALPLAKL